MASKDRQKIKEVGPWTEQTSSSGKRYYYNHETEVSQWEKPAVWREYEKKLAEEKHSKSSASKNNNGINVKSYTSSKPSTSEVTATVSSGTKRESAHGHSYQSTPLNGNSNHHSQKSQRSESYSSSRNDISKTSNSNYTPANHTSGKQTGSSTVPLILTTATSVSMPSVQLEPPPPAPIMMDEPMDVADSPPPSQEPQVHVQDIIPIPFPDVKPFDESAYQRFYKSNLCVNFRKNIISESTLTDLRKQQEKLFKSTIQLMELETQIESVKSLLWTAQTKTMLLTEKANYLADQAASIKAPHRNDASTSLMSTLGGVFDAGTSSNRDVVAENGTISGIELEPKAEEIYSTATCITQGSINGHTQE